MFTKVVSFWFLAKTHTDKTRSDHSITNSTIEDGMCINNFFCVKTFQENGFK